MPVPISKRKALAALFLGFGGGTSLMFHATTGSSFSSVESSSGSTLDSVASTGAMTSFVICISLSIACYGCLDYLKKSDKLTTILSGILGSLLSLSLIVPGHWDQSMSSSVGFPWYSVSGFFWSSRIFSILFLLRFASISLLLSIFLNFIFFSLCRTSDSPSLSSSDGFFFHKLLSFKLSFRNIIILSGVVLVFWLPVILMNGPVILPLDTMVQLIQVKGFPAWDPMMMTPLPGYYLSDHNPFLDSFIYGAFDRFGLAIGNEMSGFVLLVLIQSWVGAISLSLIICWVNSRSTLSKRFILVMFFVVLLVPSFSSYMTVVMKDSTWVPFFTIWIVVFGEIVYRIQNNRQINLKLIVYIILFATIAGLMKKTSLFITTPSTLLLMFYKRDYIKIIMSSILPPVIALTLIPALLFPLLKIAPGGRQESIGTPIQQVTKVLIDHRNEISPQDLRIINKVFSVDKAEKVWVPETVDPVKQTFKVSSTRKEVRQFLIIWIKLFFRFPVEYLRAVPFIRNAFIIGPTYFTTGSQKCGWGPSGGYAILPRVSDCSLSWQQKHLSIPFVSAINRLPPFSLLGAEAIYTAWLPLISFALCLIRKKKSQLIFLAPTVFMVLVQFLIPAYQTRYSLGFLFGAAVVIACPFILGEGALGAAASTSGGSHRTPSERILN